MDFSRAFDSLVHSKLLLKLSAYGIEYELLNWFESFLRGRTQRVLIDGQLSSPTIVKSGIGQGSILGPLFFVLFINDIADCIDVHTTCKLYADDVKLYSSFDVHCDRNSLHTRSLVSIEQWARDWQLKLNPIKSSVMHFGTRNPNSLYYIDNTPLIGSESIRDLGLCYDSKLSFTCYIDSIVTKAYQRINLIFRAFHTKNIKNCLYYIHMSGLCLNIVQVSGPHT